MAIESIELWALKLEQCYTLSTGGCRMYCKKYFMNENWPASLSHTQSVLFYSVLNYQLTFTALNLCKAPGTINKLNVKTINQRQSKVATIKNTRR